MSRLTGELVKSGQPHNLMSISTLMSESTIIAESLLTVVLQESGATPPTQKSAGSTVLFHTVMQHTAVRKEIRWVSHMPES